MCTSRRLRVTPEQDGYHHDQDNDQLLVFKIMMLVMHDQGNMNDFYKIVLTTTTTNGG